MKPADKETILVIDSAAQEAPLKSYTARHARPISRLNSGEATAKATPTSQPPGVSGNKKVLRGEKGVMLVKEIKGLMLFIDQAYSNLRQGDPRHHK